MNDKLVRVWKKIKRIIIFITRFTEQFVFVTMHSLSVILSALLLLFAGELRFKRTIFYYCFKTSENPFFSRIPWFSS
jgi:hypothetical protein